MKIWIINTILTITGILMCIMIVYYTLIIIEYLPFINNQDKIVISFFVLIIAVFIAGNIYTNRKNKPYKGKL